MMMMVMMMMHDDVKNNLKVLDKDLTRHGIRGEGQEAIGFCGRIPSGDHGR